MTDDPISSILADAGKQATEADKPPEPVPEPSLPQLPIVNEPAPWDDVDVPW